MSLRLRLFLLLAALVALLGAAQWWWVQTLTAQLEEEIAQTALSVGRSVASVFTFDDDDGQRGVFQVREGHGQEGHGEVSTTWTEDGEAAEVPRVEVPELQGAPERRWVRQIERRSGDGRVDTRTRVWVQSRDGLQPSEDLQASEDEQASGNVQSTRDGQSSEDLPRVEPAGTSTEEPAIVEVTGPRFEPGDFEGRSLPRAFELPPEGAGEKGGMVVVHRIEEIRLEGPEEAEGGTSTSGRSANEPQMLVLRGPHVEHRVELSTDGIEGALEQFSERLGLGSLLLLVVGLGLLGLVAHRVTAPLGALARTADRVGSGELGLTVPVTARGEVGRTLEAFNQMSTELAALDRDARELRARQHLSELGEVGRGIAHGLRNPLNALGLTLEELAVLSERAASGDDTEAERARRLADGARRQIRRVDSALRAFLALGSGPSGVAAAPVDLPAVVQDVVLEALQSVPEGEGRPRLRVELPDGVEEREVLRISGLEAELRAAIQALVINAVEASPPGGPVTVGLEAVPGAAPDEPRLRLTVADAGPGLAPEVRQRLFTPHVSTKPTGAGVGLFLAHRIAVDRYGGALRLEDDPAGGTRAVLELGDRREGSAERGKKELPETEDDHG